jgi:hypothetical protein
MAMASFVRDRHRLVARTEETGDLRGVLDQMECLVGHIHLHQNVAREELALGIDLPAAPHLDDLFRRDDHVLEQVLQLVLRDLLTNVLGDLALEVAVRLNDVPALGHAAVRLRSLKLRSASGSTTQPARPTR